jgi:hypothetical protein
MLDAIDSLDAVCPFQKDQFRKNGDKRVCTGSAEGSRRAEWGLHHHGIAQQFVSEEIVLGMYWPKL